MDRSNLLGSTTARRPLYVAEMGGRPLLAPPVTNPKGQFPTLEGTIWALDLGQKASIRRKD